MEQEMKKTSKKLSADLMRKGKFLFLRADSIFKFSILSFNNSKTYF
jgi:hypothetical protein